MTAARTARLPVGRSLRLRRSRGRCRHGRCRLRRAAVLARPSLDDLVELAPVEPHAATRRAVVDLDAAPLAHHKHGSVTGALHWGSSFGADRVDRRLRRAYGAKLGGSSVRHFPRKRSERMPRHASREAPACGIRSSTGGEAADRVART